MSFYRRITRERTLCSFNDLYTDDEGLLESISSFAKTPREAKFYDSFEIDEDYCCKRGIKVEQNCGKRAIYTDMNSSAQSLEAIQRDSNSVSPSMKHGRAIFKSIKKTISLEWFRRRKNSIGRRTSNHKSSWGSESNEENTERN